MIDAKRIIHKIAENAANMPDADAVVYLGTQLERLHWATYWVWGKYYGGVVCSESRFDQLAERLGAKNSNYYSITDMILQGRSIDPATAVSMMSGFETAHQHLAALTEHESEIQDALDRIKAELTPCVRQAWRNHCVANYAFIWQGQVMRYVQKLRARREQNFMAA